MSRRGGSVRKIFLPTQSSYHHHPIRRGRKILRVGIFCRLRARRIGREEAQRAQEAETQKSEYVTEIAELGHRGGGRKNRTQRPNFRALRKRASKLAAYEDAPVSGRPRVGRGVSR